MARKPGTRVHVCEMSGTGITGGVVMDGREAGHLGIELMKMGTDTVPLEGVVIKGSDNTEAKIRVMQAINPDGTPLEEAVLIIGDGDRVKGVCSLKGRDLETLIYVLAKIV